MTKFRISRNSEIGQNRTFDRVSELRAHYPVRLLALERLSEMLFNDLKKKKKQKNRFHCNVILDFFYVILTFRNLTTVP